MTASETCALRKRFAVSSERPTRKVLWRVGLTGDLRVVESAIEAEFEGAVGDKVDGGYEVTVEGAIERKLECAVGNVVDRGDDVAVEDAVNG